MRRRAGKSTAPTQKTTCLTAAAPASPRSDTFMCGRAGGANSRDVQKCSCLVESGGQECATVCQETEGCTGFMVQDNSMYAKGLTLYPPSD